MVSNIIVLITSLIIIFFVSFFTIKRGYKACSDILFMCFLYLGVLVFFYFTYGLKIEKDVINKQVNSITNDVMFLLSMFGIKLKHLPEYNISNKEKKLQIKNKKLKQHAFILVVCLFLIIFIISITIWILNNLNIPNYGLDDFGKNIIIKNIILISIVVTVQTLFSTFIIKNILPLDSEEVLNLVVDKILN
jgi:Ca2+/Na+ antiporter